MSDYDNTNTGILRRNEKRRDDKDAEYTGSVNAGGVEYWLNAWVNEGKEGGKLAGKKYFRITLQPKEAKPAAKAGPSSSIADMDSDVPFVHASPSFDLESRLTRRMRRYA